jgi:hypothetical protein
VVRREEWEIKYDPSNMFYWIRVREMNIQLSGTIIRGTLRTPNLSW